MIVDTGPSGIYLTPKAPCANINPALLQVVVGTSGGPPLSYSASCDMNLPILVTKGHLMPNFHHNMMGISPLCDHGCRVLFEKIYVTIFTKYNKIILRGWREPSGAKLWKFYLCPKDHPLVPLQHRSGPTALNAHDLPSVGAPVCYLHAATSFPVKSTWLVAIKAGNYASWISLTYSNVYKYCPVSVESFQGHLTQSRQGACSTKSKPDPLPRPQRPSQRSSAPPWNSSASFTLITW